MPDLNLVRETYASLPEEKLVQLARADKTELAEGAYQVLVEEFIRRGLDIDDLPPGEKNEEIAEEEIPEITSETEKADQARMAISYKDRMMIRANWFMFLFSILLGIGVLVMVDKMIRKGSEEKPVFGIVMIFLGLIGFIAVLYRKRIYKKKEPKFDFEKEKTDPEAKT